MNSEKTLLSLEILLLNDLFHSDAIDKGIYDMAVQKILTTKKTYEDRNVGTLILTSA